jgi:hypothetical protein
VPVFGQPLNGYGAGCVRQSVGIYSVEDASGLVLEYRQYQAVVNNSAKFDELRMTCSRRCYVHGPLEEVAQ